jgi:hypothetical protein
MKTGFHGLSQSLKEKLWWYLETGYNTVLPKSVPNDLVFQPFDPM